MKRREAIKLTLSGIALSSLSFHPLSCKAIDDETTYTYRVFSPQEVEILTILVDLFIPPSDSPGASDVRVPASIDNYVSAFMGVENQGQLKQGLASLNQLALNLHNLEIASCNSDQRNTIMEFLAADGLKSPKPTSHVFFIFRKLVKEAYFNSEKIGKYVLAYDPIPGSYIGCIDINSGTKCWTHF